MVSATIKSVFTIGIVIILLIPAFVGYIMNIRIQFIADFAISIYGIYSLVYFILQVIFTELNTKIIKKDVENRPLDWNEYGVGLVVVGYNEDKYLLRRCLESIKSNNYKNIRRIVFVIDGNEDSNIYMTEIYKSIFNDNVVKTDKLISKIGSDNFDYSIFGNDNVCIMQPHGGKREGLYTGFKILMQDPEIKVIVTTDSDTILDQNAIKELTYQCHHEDVGAVAGQIGIWNSSESLLTQIVAYRYWFSFNLERASESYWRTVMCVAGPMACYKVDVLKNIMENWYNQKFLGEQCTFGDDRHLTNRVLLEGKKVIYTEYAKGYTDTPSNWTQYLRQQTRWSKSYFREFLFNMQSVHLHPIWMCYELLYNVLYFFLLMYWCIYILYFCSIFQQSIAILVTLVVGIIKSVYGVIKSKKWHFIFFYLYSFVYFFIIIPAKITALVTLWDMNWGTRGKKSSYISTYWSSFIWISTLAGGFVYSIYKNSQYEQGNKRYTIAFIGFMVYIFIILTTIIIGYVCRKMKLFSNEIEKDFLKNKNNDIEMNQI
jgi:hyaluronan synthase